MKFIGFASRRTKSVLVGVLILFVVLALIPVLLDPVLNPGALAVLKSHVGEYPAEHRLVVTTTDRLEALHTLDLLGSRRLWLSRRVDTGFTMPFGDPQEPAVQRFNESCAADPKALYTSVLYLLDPPWLWWWNPVVGLESDADCIGALKTFCRDHGRDLRRLREAQVSEGRRLRDLLVERRVFSWCERFFGARKHAYVVLYSAVLPQRASGCTLVDCPWPFDQTAVIMVGGLEGRSQRECDNAASLIVHELTHQFYSTKDSARLSYIIRHMTPDARFFQSYPLAAVEESMAEAVSCCFLDDEWSAGQIQELIHRLEERGAAFVRVLYHRLLEYEQNRGKYPTLHDFNDEITAAVIEQAEAMGLWPPRPAGGS